MQKSPPSHFPAVETSLGNWLVPAVKQKTHAQQGIFNREVVARAYVFALALLTGLGDATLHAVSAAAKLTLHAKQGFSGTYLEEAKAHGARSVKSFGAGITMLGSAVLQPRYALVAYKSWGLSPRLSAMQRVSEQMIEAFAKAWASPHRNRIILAAAMLTTFMIGTSLLARLPQAAPLQQTPSIPKVDPTPVPEAIPSEPTLVLEPERASPILPTDELKPFVFKGAAVINNGTCPAVALRPEIHQLADRVNEAAKISEMVTAPPIQEAAISAEVANSGSIAPQKATVRLPTAGEISRHTLRPISHIIEIGKASIEVPKCKELEDVSSFCVCDGVDLNGNKAMDMTTWSSCKVKPVMNANPNASWPVITTFDHSENDHVSTHLDFGNYTLDIARCTEPQIPQCEMSCTGWRHGHMSMAERHDKIFWSVVAGLATVTGVTGLVMYLTGRCDNAPAPAQPPASSSTKKKPPARPASEKGPAASSSSVAPPAAQPAPVLPAQPAFSPPPDAPPI